MLDANKIEFIIYCEEVGNSMSRLRIEMIKNDTQLSAFDCDNSSINMLIKESYCATLFKQDCVYTVHIDGIIVGCYMLRLIQISGLSDEYSSAIFGSKFAAMKIQFLAVNKNLQRKGIGTLILERAMRQIKDYSGSLPIRYILIDALVEKIPWYTSSGFFGYKTDETPRGQISCTTRMYYDLIDKEAIDQYMDTIV